jgi:thiol-disulfide isomerase/thioredoxin
VSKIQSTFLLLALSCFAPLACCQQAEIATVRIVDFGGLKAAIPEHNGEGMLLNFWAIWCGPCVAELPELLEVAHEFHDQGGRVLGVSYDLMIPGADSATIETTVREFLEGRDHHLPTVIYDADDYNAIDEYFELPGPVPYTLAIDKAGNIVDRQEGSASKARFTEMMVAALGAKHGS